MYMQSSTHPVAGSGFTSKPNNYLASASAPVYADTQMIRRIEAMRQEFRPEAYFSKGTHTAMAEGYWRQPTATLPQGYARAELPTNDSASYGANIPFNSDSYRR